MTTILEREGRTPLDRLIAQLTLDQLDLDLYIGDSGRGKGRLFGGLVAAQSLIAAGLTVPDDVRPHSCHAYFLRPGRHVTPIRFVVHRIRDGRTFVTRRVVAHQAGEAIFSMAVSFCRPEEGIAHQDPMPDVPGPEGLPSWDEAMDIAGQERPAWRRRMQERDAIEMLVCDPDTERTEEVHEPRRQLWFRPSGPMPEDPMIHAGLIAYASDRSMVSTAGMPHAIPWDERMAASLDHAIWFHTPPRFDDWILYDTYSPAAFGGRGLIFGAMYTRDGVRVATVAQEGLVRRARPKGADSP